MCGLALCACAQMLGPEGFVSWAHQRIASLLRCRNTKNVAGQIYYHDSYQCTDQALP